MATTHNTLVIGFSATAADHWVCLFRGELTPEQKDELTKANVADDRDWVEFHRIPAAPLKGDAE